ncbi:MAG: hypothetical protein JXQ90_21190 [Cyclobacteriaceae bacterium]
MLQYLLVDGMTIKDLAITPIFIVLLTFLAYKVRPYVTTEKTRKYFLPALWIRFAGAIALGLVYQFWYGGGDTFNYFTHGSRWIWEAFMNDSILGFKLLFEEGGTRVGETFKYSQHIWYYRDPHSFFIVRIVALIDLMTFHTYSATALFFATFSFSGLWAFYLGVSQKYARSEKWLAIAILFVPSVVFWGSGILKDTITLGALGWLTFAMINLIDLRNRRLINWGIAIVSIWVIYQIKIYILICYIPTLFVWIYWRNIIGVGNYILRAIMIPILLSLFGALGYAALVQVSSSSDKYALDEIAERAAITAYDIRYGWGARTGGDGGYDLGKIDGTWQGMIRLMPAAINVSLFRPYLWEVKNPLMLLSAVESLFFTLLTFCVMFSKRGEIWLFKEPFLVFCFVFALLFAFAIGVSTFNFGTLMRYKVPLLPFYLMTLVLIRK